MRELHVQLPDSKRSVYLKQVDRKEDGFVHLKIAIEHDLFEEYTEYGKFWFFDARDGENKEKEYLIVFRGYNNQSFVFLVQLEDYYELVALWVSRQKTKLKTVLNTIAIECSAPANLELYKEITDGMHLWME